MNLLPYQEDARTWLTDNFKERHTLLLFDCPGAGKSVMSLSIVDDYDAVVVICPAIMRRTWEYEASRWASTFTPQVITSQKDELTDADMVIISYDMARTEKWKKALSKLLARKHSLLIVDEVHKIKEKSTANFKAVKKLSSIATNTLLATGTPIKNDITDIWTAVHLADKELFPTWWEFAKTFSLPVFNAYTRSGISYEGVNKETLPILKRHLKKFMLRRLQKDIQQDLPPVTTNRVYLDIEPTKPLARLTPEEAQRAVIAPTPHYATQRQELGVAKLRYVTQWLDQLLEESPDLPLLVFAHHRAVIAGLAEYFDKKDISFSTITGSDSATEKDEAIDAFQQSKIQVIVASIIAAGVGITLTRGSTCVFAELDWVPANIEQAVARLHRHGQKETVRVHYLLAADSIDADVIAALETKLDRIKEFNKE